MWRECWDLIRASSEGNPFTRGLPARPSCPPGPLEGVMSQVLGDTLSIEKVGRKLARSLVRPGLSGYDLCAYPRRTLSNPD